MQLPTDHRQHQPTTRAHKLIDQNRSTPAIVGKSPRTEALASSRQTVLTDSKRMAYNATRSARKVTRVQEVNAEVNVLKVSMIAVFTARSHESRAARVGSLLRLNARRKLTKSANKLGLNSTPSAPKTTMLLARFAPQTAQITWTIQEMLATRMLSKETLTCLYAVLMKSLKVAYAINPVLQHSQALVRLVTAYVQMERLNVEHSASNLEKAALLSSLPSSVVALLLLPILRLRYQLKRSQGTIS